MAKTVSELLKHCKKAKKWKYVYGAKGTVMTRGQIQELKDMYGPLVWDSDLNKAGYVCCDCSGLISSYTGIIRSSSNYKATAVDVDTIAELKKNWEKYVGWGIWLNGHIGVVSDAEGYYYAMDGSGRNWVHNPLSMQNWTYVIKLKDIEYDAKTSSSEKKKTRKTKKNANPNIYYRAYANKKWNGEVKNCNDTSSEGYAGVHNKPISGLMVKLSKGTVSTRVHLMGEGRWLPWVDGYDISDDKNGYAGILGKGVDGIQLKIDGLSGYEVKYRVSNVNSKSYLPWVKGTEDYAGIYGRAIDKIQIKIIKG